MNSTYSFGSELLNTLTIMLEQMQRIKTDKIQTMQDAMILMRINWEELQACLKNRKIDGFEPAIGQMIELAATTLTMATALQARIKNMREFQLSKPEQPDELAVVVPPKGSKTKPLSKK